MAWYHNGKKYWYHNGRKYSKKMKYGTYKLKRDRDTWLKFADESNSWFDSFYKKRKNYIKTSYGLIEYDPKKEYNRERRREEQKAREWEDFISKK